MYSTSMIVFSANKPRLNNFNTINELFNNSINKFEAINTIDNFKYWLDFSLKNSYTTQEYINKHVLREGKGKLGCNLSHQLLLEQIYKK